MSTTNYILSHKDFQLGFSDYQKDKYVVLTTKDIKCDMPNVVKFDTDLPDEMYGEMTFLKWIKDNCTTEWFNTSHYRRLLQPIYHKVCYVEKMNIGQLYQQYYHYHSKQIMDRFVEYLKNTDKGKYVVFDNIMKQNLFVPYNLFQIPMNFINVYWEWVCEPIIDFTQNVLGIHSIEEMDNYITTTDALEERPNKNNSIVYQRRFPCCMQERLSTAFWTYVVDGAYQVRVKLMESGQKL